MIKKLWFWVCLGCGLWGSAQQETQFWLSPYQLNSVNPAMAAIEGSSELIVHSNSQWTSLDSAPKTFAFSYAQPTKNKLAIGINFITDKVYVEKQTQAFLDFSYPLQLSADWHLSLGFKAGGNFYSAATQNLQGSDGIFDPAQRSINTFRFNVGAGLYLHNKNLWVALSRPRLVNSALDSSEWVQAQDRIHTYFGVGYDWSFNTTWNIEPSLLAQKVKGLPTVFSYNAAVAFDDKFRVGLSLRSSGELGVTSLLSISEKWAVGYAFAQPTQGSLAGLQIRSHEILLKIKLGGSARVAFEKEEE